jgi:methyl halide transferase
MNVLDECYWTRRYQSGETGWDLGTFSPPLDQYLCQIKNKSMRLLIPGAGNAHEVIRAWQLGFTNVHLLDISDFPLQRFMEGFPDFPKNQIHHEDFFKHQGTYDLILEQTFFCALDPSLRMDYSKKVFHLLEPGGRLVGVLFDRVFPVQGPPFGGNAAEYRTYFESNFLFEKFEPCYNSAAPRVGSELFINLKKSDIED